MALFSFRKKAGLPNAEEALPGRAEEIPVPDRHFVTRRPIKPPFPEGLDQAVFGLGCFWGAERIFWQTPGVFTTAPFVHEYWEEVYLVEGDLTVGNDALGRGGESFAPGTYACRPPGAVHGPFRSNGGCLLLEIHYFAQ